MARLAKNIFRRWDILAKDQDAHAGGLTVRNGEYVELREAVIGTARAVKEIAEGHGKMLESITGEVKGLGKRVTALEKSGTP